MCFAEESRVLPHLGIVSVFHLFIKILLVLLNNVRSIVGVQISLCSDDSANDTINSRYNLLNITKKTYFK